MQWHGVTPFSKSSIALHLPEGFPFEAIASANRSPNAVRYDRFIDRLAILVHCINSADAATLLLSQ